MAVKMFTWILSVVMCFVYLQVTYASNKIDGALEPNDLKEEVDIYQELRNIIGFISRLTNDLKNHLLKITKVQDETIDKKDIVERKKITLYVGCRICQSVPGFRSKRRPFSELLARYCYQIKDKC